MSLFRWHCACGCTSQQRILVWRCISSSSARLKTHYEVLGVDRNASRRDIRLAYLALSKKHHPDVQQQQKQGGKVSREHDSFLEISEAYGILSDPQKRNSYNLQLLHRTNLSHLNRHSHNNHNPHYPQHQYASWSDQDFATAVNWEASSQHKPNHSRVLLSLVAIMIFGTGLQLKRAHIAHQNFDKGNLAMGETQTRMHRNVRTYRTVRERARNSSMQEAEQMERLQEHAQKSNR